MTKEKFKAWVLFDVNRKPLNPYEEWVYYKAYSILREEPYNREKAKAFYDMIKFDFASSLYLFISY